MRILLVALISMTMAVTSFAQSRGGGGRSYAGHSIARGYGGYYRGYGRYYGGFGVGFGLGYGYAPYYCPYSYYYRAPIAPVVVIGGRWRHFR